MSPSASPPREGSEPGDNNRSVSPTPTASSSSPAAAQITIAVSVDDARTNVRVTGTGIPAGATVHLAVNNTGCASGSAPDVSSDGLAVGGCLGRPLIGTDAITVTVTKDDQRIGELQIAVQNIFDAANNVVRGVLSVVGVGRPRAH